MRRLFDFFKKNYLKDVCNKKKAEIKCTNINAPTVKQKNDGIPSLNQSLQTIVPMSFNQSFHWTYRAKLIQQALLIHHQFMKTAKFSQKKFMKIYCKIRLKQTIKERIWKLFTQNLNQVRPANQLKLVLKKGKLCKA